jgi:hypothetical protein
VFSCCSVLIVRLEELVKMMEYKKLNPEDFAWYLDLRKYGTVPHSGFGMLLMTRAFSSLWVYFLILILVFSALHYFPDCI